jgi:outer membrane lipoprotein LolB
VIRRAAACSVLLLAAGCATLPPAGDAGSWPARRAALQSLETWTLDGRVAVATDSEGFSGGLAWRQDGARAEIELRGPLGGTALSLRVDGAAVTVTDGHGSSVDGDAAREFVKSELGAPLPVSEMRYWLVGVPAPGVPHLESVGPDGRLASLEQDGWQVNYPRYQAVGKLALPARIEITSKGVRLRLAVANWRLAP